MLRHPAANNERSVGLFLAMGYHDALLRRRKQTYADRSQRMAVASALAAHLPQVDVHDGRRRVVVSGCASPSGVDTRALAAAGGQPSAY